MLKETVVSLKMKGKLIVVGFIVVLAFQVWLAVLDDQDSQTGLETEAPASGIGTPTIAPNGKGGIKIAPNVQMDLDGGGMSIGNF